MKIVDKIRRWVRRPQDLLLGIVMSTCRIWPDSLYLKCLVKFRAGYWPNLKHPRTYDEKLQWLKMYDHRPEYTTMVDKITAKDYVAGIIGKEYIIPTLKIYNNSDEINLDELPDKFVLKTNNGSANMGVVVCQNKSTFDLTAAKAKLNDSLKRDKYWRSREWPYKNIKPRIFAEKYMEDPIKGDLQDYKFFCFDGVVNALFVGSERSTGDVKFDYFDADFNHLDIVQEHPMSGHEIPKPKNFELMKELASKLSKGIPQVRVDLYNIDGKIYFGELTFFHHGGIIKFNPKEWDYTFGSWIKLPEKQVKK